jgi:hypothetical protein
MQLPHVCYRAPFAPVLHAHLSSFALTNYHCFDVVSFALDVDNPWLNDQTVRN